MIQNALLSEIQEQPEALRRVARAYACQDAHGRAALKEAAALMRRSNPIIFTGMATSEYASYPASILLNRSGKVNFVQDVSELLHYHLSVLQPGACLVLVSQSGNSAEIVHILEEVEGRVPVIGVFNDETSALARYATIPLSIYAGPQNACGSKTNLSSMAVLLLLAEAALGRDLGESGERLETIADDIAALFPGWEERLAPAAGFLEGSPYTAFLGRGPGRASALFSSCLFREVPKVVSEGMGAAAFRHGLREMIRPEHRVVIFAPGGRTHSLLVGLGRDLLNLEVPLMLVTNQEANLPSSPGVYLLRTKPHDELWAPLLDMVPLQLVGYLLALRKGLEPGRLVISTYVTTVE